MVVTVQYECWIVYTPISTSDTKEKIITTTVPRPIPDVTKFSGGHSI